MIIASIMTGTSVDGIDISIIDVITKKKYGFYSFDFSKKEKDYIETFLWPNNKNMAEISTFNFWFSECISKYFLKIESNILQKVEYVVFHGQTTFHNTKEKKYKNFSTMQLGNGGALANKIKKNVISDLRSSDVSVGGEGAPLVIYGDKELFWDKKSKFYIFNIGGISNVSIIEKNGKLKSYDVGPGNALIDAVIKKEFSLPYDIDGKIGKKGVFDKKIFDKLIDSDYFAKLTPPKSSGKEFYNIDFIINNKLYDFDVKNLINTLCYYTAYLIKKTINEGDFYSSKIIVAGGGAKNPLILKYLSELIPNIELSNEYGIELNEREAASFAYLGYFYLKNMKIGETTGATEKTIPGSMYKV